MFIGCKDGLCEKLAPIFFELGVRGPADCALHPIEFLSSVDRTKDVEATVGLWQDALQSPDPLEITPSR